MPRTRTRAQQEQESQTYASSTGSGISFRDGVMFVDGSPQRPNRVQQWWSSNELTKYTTVEWADPATGQLRTSCNCPGWTVKKADKDRCCCHTKDMEGVKACSKRKADDIQQIHSVEEAQRAIPEIIDGRELRGIMLD